MSSKVAINGASSATSPELQDQVTLALLQNGGVDRIQAVLQQRLDEAGWSENVRDYVTKLFRSGECTTFFEAFERVKSHITVEGAETGRKKTANGTAGVPDLSIPKTAAEGAVDAVRKELIQVCELKK
ncbi:hypothetical protein AMS68_003514 [Peltaster fructicola]|uniref:Transcription and mRNA export factor SUS1 n=1 Tax=Peltaster fructicola TaxID=286661 RepID=A0A6H0XTA1_9PEZI|nr:hypothetical protein AMS68_003514 [Peltaster fructicola]